MSDCFVLYLLLTCMKKKTSGADKFTNNSCAIEEEDIPKLVGFLKRQEANGKFFSKAMQKEPVTNTEEV